MRLNDFSSRVWFPVTSSDQAEFITWYLIAFDLSVLLCFFNACLVMKLLNNFLQDIDHEKNTGSNRDSSGKYVTSAVYFRNCIALTQAIECEID